jgi:hypothetical protein
MKPIVLFMLTLFLNACDRNSDSHPSAQSTTSTLPNSFLAESNMTLESQIECGDALMLEVDIMENKKIVTTD